MTTTFAFGALSPQIIDDSRKIRCCWIVSVVKQWKKYGSILTGICVDSSPQKRVFSWSVTRFCHSITKMQQQIHVFFNIIVAGDFFQVIICAYGAWISGDWKMNSFVRSARYEESFLLKKSRWGLKHPQRLVFTLLFQELSMVRRLLDIPFN